MNNSEFKKRKFVEDILNWHKKNKISFPWRETEDPYAVLIAEILLKKTTRIQVINIYSSFMEKYPTVFDLASADPKELENLIKPLGMQIKRARILISIAKELLEKYGGEVPLNKIELEKISGIGSYTANAVLTLAGNFPFPMVDTNVIRVISRVFSFQPKKTRAREDKNLWEFVQSLVPSKNAKEFNLSLLDFANLICKPKNPKCSECPLSDICEYKKL